MTADGADASEPPDGNERDLLLGWLAFHRSALERKCSGLTDEELAVRPVPPSNLSLLGLMRHLTEMERVYAVWALGPPGPLRFVWGIYADDGPEWDFDGDVSTVSASRLAWMNERTAADQMIDAHASLDTTAGNGHSVRWNILKLLGEYTRHNGHADLIRERIDGATGE